MKLGYTIVYVPDVSASLAFFENAFGMKRKFLHESGTYGELDKVPNVKLYPGMAAMVMIPTVERSAFDYFVGPLVMSFRQSFRQL